MSETDTNADVTKSWGWFMTIGILLILGGLLALYAPFAASLAVEAIVGVAFLAAGILALAQIFMTEDGWGARAAYLLLGLLNIAAGVLLLARPLEGLLALTLLLATVIMVNGIMRAIIGFQMRPEDGWGWTVAGGLLSILMAMLIFTQYPGISIVLIGIFAAASLIGDGISYIVFAFALKAGRQTPAAA